MPVDTGPWRLLRTWAAQPTAPMFSGTSTTSLLENVQRQQGWLHKERRVRPNKDSVKEEKEWRILTFTCCKNHMHAKDDDEQPPSLHVSGTGRILAVVLVTNLFPSFYHGSMADGCPFKTKAAAALPKLTTGLRRSSHEVMPG